ncbi:uncharacterized protein LOC143863495 [Tasmannia lanceolata]|uniref:uncharacterized protein LOC143863495 n=1 Tax=Tasmannia lanceolata TaxID=3420 RepID=UPI004064233A
MLTFRDAETVKDGDSEARSIWKGPAGPEKESRRDFEFYSDLGHAAPKGKTTVKLVGAYDRGAGSSKSGGTSTGARPPPARSGDNVFRPNCAIQKSNSGLGESRVAVEIVTKGLLNQDKLQVLNEPPAAADEAIFSSLYQIGLYYNDFREKSKKFSEAITKSEEESDQLMKEAEELQRSIGERDAAN